MPRASLAVIALVMFLPTAANAACGTLNLPDAHTSPATSPMTSGGTITVTLGSLCDAFGLNVYPDTNSSTHSTFPQHGTVTMVNSSNGEFTYTNNGDGATSDSFNMTDASDLLFTVNVAIATPTSSIVVSPNALSALQAGTSFSQSLSATGGTAPYTFALDSGSPPPGLSLSGNTISGTPTQRGSYSFAVKATDNTGATQVKSYSGTVAVPDLTLTPSSSQGSVGTPFSVTFAPGGGVAPYYNPSLEIGSTLPPGLTLSGFTLSGTPTATGTYSFRIVYFDSSTGTGTYFQYVPVTVTIVATPPAISTVTPASGPVTGGTPVTITGTGFTGATAVTFDGAPATSFSVGSDTSISAAAPAHAAGAVPVAVTTATSGTVSKPNGFTYVSPAPVANPVSATVAYGSTNNPITLTITGSAPTSVAVDTQATHGTATASGTSITYTPTAGYAGPDSFTYTATNAGGTSAPATATITVSPPTITYAPASPPAGAVGAAYSQSIAAASGGTAPYTYALASGTLPANVTLNGNGTLTGTPTAPGTFSFAVTVTDSSTGTGPFSSAPANVTVTINPAAPTVSSVAPTSGSTAGGTSVTITGSGFTGASAVTFGGTAATGITVVNDITITATAPAHAAGAVAVAVTTPGGNASLPNGFTYSAAAPTISAVAPNSGPAAGGTAVTITGTGFTGTTAVTFGGTAATGITVVNDTTITATTPAHPAGAVAVAVTAPGGNASLPNGFTYAPALTLASVAPNSGSTAGGTAVTLTGTGFTGVTVVTFDGTAATGITVVNDTTITATTPAHAAGAVTVAVMAPGGGAQGLVNGFTYIAPVPTIASAAPNTGSAIGGTAVTITGTGFTGATVVTFGGTAATGITVVNDTTITATTPAHVAGTVAVAVTTPGGNASLPNGFTYAAPVPTIASTAPNTGPATGGTAVTINGTGFTGATSVTFGGSAATSFTVNSDTSITATTPAHAAGAVAVGVAAPGGNANLPSGFTYAAPVPTVASHTLELLAGTSGTVDLTQGATGGPFTAAAIITPPPAADGTASITHSGTQWQLVYASTAGAASTVVVRYTLSNASGTSAPGTVTFTVIARPDPSRDPEVIGLLNAQAQSAQRFAKSQITNFRDRLEQLHDDSNREAASMNVRLGIPQDPNDPNALGYAQENRPYDPTRSAFAYGPDDAGNARGLSDRTPAPGNRSPSDVAFWAGGFVNFGTANDYKIDLEHTLIGVSGGVDYRFSPTFTAGIGFGYGRDTVDVGVNGTESDGQAFSTAVYGSYHPQNNVFVDGLLGYSALDFGSKRFVTPTSGFANGDRSGSQVFGSISSGYEYKEDGFLVSPYGRLEAAWTKLKGFTESGAAPYDLTFGDQTMNMLAGVIGVRGEYDIPQDWGLLKARGRLEYTHDFSGSSWASMGYADLNNGLPYTLDIDAFTRDYLAVGLGFDATVGNGATIGFDYTTAFGFDGDSQTHNFALRFGAKF